jgi:hypothetical protein
MFSKERFDLLINTLKSIETDESITKRLYLINTNNSLVLEAEKLASEVLINERATGVNYSMVQKMEEKGYDVFPGEKDSFGWLSACIQTKKGTIVFG